MKKKLIAAAVVCAAAVSLAACGGSSSGSSSSGSASAPAQVSSSAGAEQSSAASSESTQAAAATGGETVDVGDYTVLLPEGWMGVNQTDVFADQEEDGSYPIRTDAYGMIKGGESEWDVFSKPVVYTYYYADKSTETQVEGTLWFYDASEEIDVTVNGTKCTAYHVLSDLAEEGSEEEDKYEYDLVFIPNGEDSCFQVQMLTYSTENGDYGISATDPEVVAIMESLQAK